jgi:hypothetical protein
MKNITRFDLLILCLFTLVGVTFRVVNNEFKLFNFNPTLAIALVAGMIMDNKKLVILPSILVMLFTDIYFEAFTDIPGFYGLCQVINYLAIASVAILGIALQKAGVSQILGGTIGGSILFFIISNFGVWVSGFASSSHGYSLDLAGLTECYVAALPFYKSQFATELFMNSLFSSVFFSVVLIIGVRLLAPKTIIAS